jgi:prepilin-type N-terminal cleavage/methylation domain-containing protein
MKNILRNIFTLVELLVVIAIIGILASMLLPALKTARDKTQGIICTSNLKQLYSGLVMYSVDYDDYLLPWSGPPWWVEKLNTYVSSNIYKPETVFRCPVSSRPPLDNNGAYGYTSYGIGYHAIAPATGTPLRKLSKFTRPNETLIMSDFEPDISENGYTFFQWSGEAVEFAKLGFLHSKRSNGLTFSGVIMSSTYKELIAKKNNPTDSVNVLRFHYKGQWANWTNTN